MNKLFKLWFYIILLSSTAMAIAQNVTELEAELSKLTSERNNLLEALRSQHTELDKQIEIINYLKRNKAENEGRLRAEMRKSKSLSENIGRTEIAVHNVEQKTGLLKHRMRSRYSHLIDSLQNAGKDLSDRQLNAHYFRRLELSPVIKSFSFNPNLVNDSNLSTADSLEEAIIRNYLELAIAEIDSNLNLIDETETEIARQLSFARKTERFLDDIGDNPGFGFSSSEVVASNSKSNVDGDYGRWDESLVSASRPLQDLIIQMSPFISITGESGAITGTEITNLDQYLNLVQQTQQYLKLYRISITEKLNR